TIKQPMKFKHIEYPRSEKKLPIVLSVEEIQSMFDVCENKKHKIIRIENGEFNAYCTEHKESYNDVYFFDAKSVLFKFAMFWGLVVLINMTISLNGVPLFADPGTLVSSFYFSLLVIVVCLTKFKNGHDYLKVK
ncbi:MAG: hypothetical protein AABY22_22025, partial [Nanoarchaeota archaeon]